MSGCYEVTMLASDAAIAIRLKPCPTIRALSAVETQAVIELRLTAPSLPDLVILSLAAPAGGNTP